MSRATRDLSVAGGIVLAIVVSLILARLLTAAPAASTDRQTPSTARTTAQPPPADPAFTTRQPSTPSSVRTRPGTVAAPTVSVVLSSGDQVVPRPDPSAPTYRLPFAPPSASPTPPRANPEPTVFADPAAVAGAWLAALCWYDYRDPQGENTRRAAPYGDTSMPPGQDPWTLNDQAWTQITTDHLGSGCTDITATAAHTGRDGVDQDTVTLTATQILSANGTPYQAIPITLTRTLRQNAGDGWLIGAAVTAN